MQCPTVVRPIIFVAESIPGSASILSDKGGLHIDDKTVGLSISQWLPCLLAIWNLLFGMAIWLNLVKSF